MNGVRIPEGEGVRCPDCSVGARVSTDPPLYQEKDERLERLFKCPKQPGWKRIHEDMVHRCADMSPQGDEVRFYPLPPPAARMALEQKAADPENDRINAFSQANRLSKMPGTEAYLMIERIKRGSPLLGEMVEGLYDEIRTIARKNEVKKRMP